MKISPLLLGVVLVVVIADHSLAFNPFRYPVDFARGSHDMWRAYRDMKRSNWKKSDKFFHARGNYDAARRGTGGRHAAALLSNAREWIQWATRRHHEDYEADQEANRWGRNGGDPNRYRPDGLTDDYIEQQRRNNYYGNSNYYRK